MFRLAWDSTESAGFMFKSFMRMRTNTATEIDCVLTMEWRSDLGSVGMIRIYMQVFSWYYFTPVTWDTFTRTRGILRFHVAQWRLSFSGLAICVFCDRLKERTREVLIQRNSMKTIKILATRLLKRYKIHQHGWSKLTYIPSAKCFLLWGAVSSWINSVQF